MKLKSSGTTEVCTWRILISSPKRTFLLSGPNDEAINKWITNINKLLSIAFDDEERKAKEEAAKVSIYHESDI